MDIISQIASVHSYSIDEITPSMSDIVISMGINNGVTVPADVQFLIDRAMELFNNLVQPEGITKSIHKDAFLKISEGESHTEKRYPLQGIVPLAERLELFAFTLGKNISDEIQKLIHEKDYPLGYALDIIASRSAELATTVQEKRFIESSDNTKNNKALLYSPGYCGWDISVQQRIFKYLNPGDIEITLNESSLMSPIKSVSGILICGKPEIHNFKNNFSFCRTCTTYSCRERMKH